MGFLSVADLSVGAITVLSNPQLDLRLLRAVGLFWGSTVHLSSGLHFGSSSQLSPPPAKNSLAESVFSLCLYCTSFSPLSYYLFNFFVDFWRYFFIYLLWRCLFCSYSASLLHLLTQKQTIVHLAQYPVWFIPYNSTQWLIHGGRKTMLATVSLRVIFQINWS